MKTITLSILIFFLFGTHKVQPQDYDSIVIANIYKEALTSDFAYKQLEYLCKNTSGRLCGSVQAAAAVEWAKQLMGQLEADTVYLQRMEVPHWVRGEKETARIISQRFGATSVQVCALGGSVGTSEHGISAEVVEVQNFQHLEKLGKPEIEGKIVFFNRPVDLTYINTFRSYGSAVDQRISGPAKAAKYGAAGVIVRSVTTSMDTTPHTGISRYDDGDVRIPAVAISTLDADLLSSWLKKDPLLRFYLKTNCEWLPNEQSFNVIGELTGTHCPNEFITVGGHLDSWDVGEGAHDDGAGCIHTIEALRLFKKLGIRPRHTIRFVMFMDEEVAQSGANEYAKCAEVKKEKHFFALESDRGGIYTHGI